MPPGARWNIEPCVASPPRVVPALTRRRSLCPWSRADVDQFAGLEILHQHAIAYFGLSFDSSIRHSGNTSWAPTPAFLKCPVMALLTRCGLTNSTRRAARLRSRLYLSCGAAPPRTAPLAARAATARIVVKTCVMPNLIPMIPLTAISFLSQNPLLEAAKLLPCVAESLDLHVYARRQIQLHQCVDRVRRRLEDVD